MDEILKLSPDGLSILGVNDKRIKEIDIPNCVISIEDRAFADCIFLEIVDIPNSVKFIGREAFSNCFRLISIDIPNSVSYIGNGAFSSCM